MTNPNADSRSQELTRCFIEKLTQQSIRLFSARVEMLSEFYRDVFDYHPICARIIGTPSGGQQVSPTTYMIYREARFVLDSDASESHRLDLDWAFLHVKVQDELNPKLSVKMAGLNYWARLQVIKCQERMGELAPQLATLLEARRYDEAQCRFWHELLHVDQTFDEIITSYNLLAPQPH